MRATGAIDYVPVCSEILPPVFYVLNQSGLRNCKYVSCDGMSLTLSYNDHILNKISPIATVVWLG